MDSERKRMEEELKKQQQMQFDSGCEPSNTINWQSEQTQQGTGVLGPKHYKANENGVEFALKQLFTYHPPTLEQQRQYDAIRAAARYFAKVIIDNTPPGHDRIGAIMQVRGSVMQANAGIALNGLQFDLYF